jgi:phosphohistidine phosphatase SixA
MVAITVGTGLAASPTAAQENGPDLVRALRDGGYVVFLRHAATDQQQADTDRTNLANCATQRNLSPEGRKMAHEIGEAFRKLRIRVGKVLTSPFCRTVETGVIAFGKHEKAEALRFAMGLDQVQRARYTDEVRRMLGTVPAKGTNTVLVSHHGNLKEAAGIWPKREGDAHVFRPRPDGTFEHVGEVSAADWTCWSGPRSDCPRAAAGN